MGGGRRSIRSSRVLPHPASVLAAVLSPDGKTVLTGCADGKARVWDAASGQLRGPVLSHPKAVEAVAFSPDGRIGADGKQRPRRQAVGRVHRQAHRHADESPGRKSSPWRSAPTAR